MSSPIKLLKQAVKEGNWGKVCEAYNDLTGETINSDHLDNLPNSNRYKKMVQQISDVINDDSGMVEATSDEEETPSPKTQKVKRVGRPKKMASGTDVLPVLGNGEVNMRGRKPMFPTADLEDSNAAKLNKKLLRKDRMVRPPPAQVMKECTECRREFNFTKTYPAGNIMISSKDSADTKSNRLLCEKCQLTPRAELV